MHRRSRKSLSLAYDVLFAFVVGSIVVTILGLSAYEYFEKRFAGRVYPSVSVAHVPFGGKSKEEVVAYWLLKNQPFEQATFTLSFQDHVATLSGTELGIGYDATLSATQAYLVGRSGHILSDLLEKFLMTTIDLRPYFRWNEDVLDTALTSLSQEIDIPAQDALFQFTGGRVTAFRLSRPGRQINRNERADHRVATIAGLLSPVTSMLPCQQSVTIVTLCWPAARGRHPTAILFAPSRERFARRRI